MNGERGDAGRGFCGCWDVVVVLLAGAVGRVRVCGEGGGTHGRAAVGRVV